MLEVEATC